MKTCCLIFGLVISFALLFTGCAVGPDYIRPEAPEPQKWLEQDDTRIKIETGDYSRWWKAFNDPVLDTLIEKAYHQNLTLRIAGIRILEARAELGIAFGNQFPQFQQLRGGYTYTSASENTANTGSGDLSYGDVDVGFDAAWELDFWGKFRRAVQSNVASLDASIANYDDFLVTLTAEVARAYVQIRTFEQRLFIARENVKVQKRSLKIARVRFEAGEVTELDVMQAITLLKNTEASIPRLEAGLRQTQNALCILLGTTPSDLQDVLGERIGIPTAPAEVAVGVPAELLRRRPDIRLAESRVAAQSPLIGVAKADLFPHFTLFGSIGLRSSNGKFTKDGGDGGSDLSDLFDSDSIEFFGGPTFSWDIFNYGRIKNRVRVQDARLQELVVNYQNTVLRAAQEVEDALVGFLRSQEEEALLSESVKAAKRSVEIAVIQYREGIESYQRVLDTQRAQAEQEDFFAYTSGSVVLNLIAIYKALGGGWEIREGKNFVPEKTREEMEKRTNWGDLLD
jgi:NodT family efflux transporter outer membrane factor (OMF) lipoprotein